jgi:PAS domain S-box-containing protein
MREIAQVSAALEDARIALQHSLTSLRQEKAWTDHLLESVTEGIVTLDRFGRITYFSPGAERITGWKQGQAIGKPVDEVFQMPEAGASFRQSIGTAKEKQILATVRFNGGQATLAVTGANLAPPAAGRAGTALVFRDVSDEEALRRLLGDFLANITHEFRTPLSALAASIELLLDQLPTLSQAETEELLDALRLGIVNLQTLIDNLLEGASIEAGRFRVHAHPVELASVITAAVQTMQPLVEKYGQVLVSNLPPDLPPVQADPRRTGQVLVNLLSNAVKWGPSGAELLLYAEACEREVIVSVGDRGPGIPPDQKANIFNRFNHLRSENQRAETGAGLGLSVVKAVVEAQGGRVSVMDREGGGSIFQFTIPTVDPNSASEEPQDESAGR